ACFVFGFQSFSLQRLIRGDNAAPKFGARPCGRSSARGERVMGSIGRRGWRVALAMGGLFLLASCASADGARTLTDQQADEEALGAVRPVPYKNLGDAAGPGEMRCHAKIVTAPNGEVVPMANPQGLGPADLQSAYALPTSGGNGKTVAIVDAYDAPNAEA